MMAGHDSTEISQPSPFLKALLSKEPAEFDRTVEDICAGRELVDLLEDATALDEFWPETDNLYLRVRALIFLYHLHRFVFPVLVRQGKAELLAAGFADLRACPIPLLPTRHLQARNYVEAIAHLQGFGVAARLNETLSSGMASGYHGLALQNLANQVRASVRSETGNQWIFRIGHPDDFPLRFVPQLTAQSRDGVPWLIEETAVRMDLSHSCWSDIFFLGMDRPEFAKVINTSIDLCISGRGEGPVPPCLSAIRVIDRPVIRLVSLDLECSAEVSDLASVFDFGRDYLGLLKAAVIASGLVPPGMEGSQASLSRVLARLAGPGRGFELVSWVRDIPKGSRLAVSTNLLGGMISVCMRATGQIRRLDGPLQESERRTVAARAILGEWLGGSGGGWQDSGGVWPGIKLIEGCFANGRIADPMSPSQAVDHPATESPGSNARGALLPRHTRLDGDYVPDSSVKALEDALILVHGGMAANVGPILEMVTERYLLRNAAEWQARAESLSLTSATLEALRAGDIRLLGDLTTRHFFGPLKAVIPWASNTFTERLIQEVREAVGSAFWGFWMLGGMSGGGMGFIIEPSQRDAAKRVIQEILLRLKQEFEHSLPFAMDPVIYDFRINKTGTTAHFSDAGETVAARADFMREYHRLVLPQLLQKEPSQRNAQDNTDLQRVRYEARLHAETYLDVLLPSTTTFGHKDTGSELDRLLAQHGFDPQQHEQIREDLRSGRIGLRHNRLHPNTEVADVSAELIQMRHPIEACRATGNRILRSGQCAVVTLAAGAGSRWSHGAGVVKALHPFAPVGDSFRRFIEIHVAKTQHSARAANTTVPHLITTSYLTHDPIHDWLNRFRQDHPDQLDGVDLRLSPGRSVGLRFTPTVSDLRYAWYELPGERLDEQAEKMRDSVRQALIGWAQSVGEASDYRDNLPLQCLHPVGHWYEVANLFLNGTLASLLQQQPQLRYLLLHNIDTLGASLDPALLGHHVLSSAPLTFELIQRRFDDVGGGLARINGHMRLIEGFALPCEEDEFRLSFYNTLTCWIDLDQLLPAFGLHREDFSQPIAQSPQRILNAVRRTAERMPTYITLKEAKKRWGRGQEDVFPVLQFERLWGDMSAFFGQQFGSPASFLLVPRSRGQQLKDPAQLDPWMREGGLRGLEWLP